MDEYIKKSDLIAYITRKRDFINQNSDYYGKDGYYIADDICTDILGDIYSNVIPSAEPKTGHWIYDRTRDWDGECKYECSECGMGSDVDYDYCMRCGARMVEPQERSDKE